MKKTLILSAFAVILCGCGSSEAPASKAEENAFRNPSKTPPPQAAQAMGGGGAPPAAAMQGGGATARGGTAGGK